MKLKKIVVIALAFILLPVMAYETKFTDEGTINYTSSIDTCSIVL